ncbi:putative ribonuclease III domain-containing protein [Septoria linicola]|nr:putative ribonuclease III domain-containing protein [Septoria linicola]
MTDQSLTASSAPAMACPAMKVFGVPELLEHILFLAVSDQWLGNHSKLNFGPMPGCGKLREGGICLFRIQRVDRTFKNTIVGSPKLRQLMYLAPTNHSEGRDAAEDVIEDGTQEELESDHAKDLLPDHNPFSCLVDQFLDPAMAVQDAQAFIAKEFGYEIESLNLVREAMDTTGLIIDESNSRLAVVGDTVLRTAIAGLWYPTRKPKSSFNRTWQRLASNVKLAGYARQIGLGTHLSLHPAHIGPISYKTLATGLEAVFGAIYQDCGGDISIILNSMRAIGMDVDDTE